MTRGAPIPDTVTLHVPFRIVKRGGRKEMQLPDGAARPRPRVDNAMVKALARAFRWRKQLYEGLYGTLEELARAKGVAPSYVSRVLRLTLLAPEIVEAILDGRQPAELKLDSLLNGFPLEWEGQPRPELGRGAHGDRAIDPAAPIGQVPASEPQTSLCCDGLRQTA
ncbi:hypothetical protein [Amaricoccus macauensis]|uniref:hypothetical protein n=1 Tax=Amaricoccus macauensis TaxID=57001 RepID=UPI003C7AD139